MSEDQTITIEVDGRPLKARPGAMLIEVTDAAGIRIPRFCYHEKLSIAANCRMCLVEVERVPKPLPACATPVTDGMKVHTRSPTALAAQQGTMEFLLINHPLDCPICDQGGECELQDVAMGYGADASRYTERKRVVADPDIGPLIATDLTRCIHCTRCVRFGEEIAGLRELGATGRGEHMRIGTYVQHSVSSELSGNVIDLCPVGALTSKPFRYQARAWELTQKDAVAPHDAVGSNLHLHIRRNQVLRAHPRANEAINEVWISDRDRFSFQGLYSEDRLHRPLLKQKGSWREVEWSDALDFAARGIRETTDADAERFAALLSPTATLEEHYLAQKITRGLGSGNVDHRLRQSDFRGDADEPRVPWLGLPIADLEQLKGILLIGCNLRKEQPLLNHRLRKAALAGAAVACVNPRGYELNYAGSQLVRTPAAMAGAIAAIGKALKAKAKGIAGDLIGSATPSQEDQKIAQALAAAGQHGAVFLGALARAHPDYAVLRDLGAAVARAAGCVLGYIPEANSVGACLAGALPQCGPGGAPLEKPGGDALGVLEQPRDAYLLLGAEPGFDFWSPRLAREALSKAGCVVALTAYRSRSLDECADVMLPVGLFPETSGTFVNAAGTWQGFSGAVSPPGEARPAWKVLRVLGNLLGLEGFDYVHSEQVREELAACCKPLEANRIDSSGIGELRCEESDLIRIAEVPIYAVDALVRRAAALQQTDDGNAAAIRLNAQQAEKLGLSGAERLVVSQDGVKVAMPLVIDPGLPDGCVGVPAGVPGTEGLGNPFGAVTLEKG